MAQRTVSVIAVIPAAAIAGRRGRRADRTVPLLGVNARSRGAIHHPGVLLAGPGDSPWRHAIQEHLGLRQIRPRSPVRARGHIRRGRVGRNTMGAVGSSGACNQVRRASVRTMRSRWMRRWQGFRLPDLDSGATRICGIPLAACGNGNPCILIRGPAKVRQPHRRIHTYNHCSAFA